MRLQIDPSHLAFMTGSDPAASDIERRSRPGDLRRGCARVVGDGDGTDGGSVWIVCEPTGIGTGTAQSLRTERRAHDAQTLAIYALVLLGVWRLMHKHSIEPLVDHWQHSSWMTAYAVGMQGVGYMHRDGFREPTRERTGYDTGPDTAPVAVSNTPRAALDGEALFRSAERDVEIDELLNAREDPAEG
ncbi:MAG: hypothetical protein QOJ07_1643 [Thermoleophilaceae bacterium]|nr:hypothetical protein [Thermoleophilaceae bacterium]